MPGVVAAVFRDCSHSSGSMSHSVPTRKESSSACYTCTRPTNMNPAVIDTLRFADRLKSSGIEAMHAEGIARALGDELADRMLTRHDLDQALEPVRDSIQAIEARLDGLDPRFDAIDAKFDAIDAKFEANGRQVRSDGRQVRGLAPRSLWQIQPARWSTGIGFHAACRAWHVQCRFPSRRRASGRNGDDAATLSQVFRHP